MNKRRRRRQHSTRDTDPCRVGLISIQWRRESRAISVTVHSSLPHVGSLQDLSTVRPYCPRSVVTFTTRCLRFHLSLSPFTSPSHIPFNQSNFQVSSSEYKSPYKELVSLWQWGVLCQQLQTLVRPNSIFPNPQNDWRPPISHDFRSDTESDDLSTTIYRTSNVQSGGVVSRYSEFYDYRDSHSLVPNLISVYTIYTRHLNVQ